MAVAEVAEEAENIEAPKAMTDVAVENLVVEIIEGEASVPISTTI